MLYYYCFVYNNLHIFTLNLIHITLKIILNHILRNKSKENIKAAKILHENEHYNSSVHCSYYSSYQYILHIIKNFNPAKYQLIEIDVQKNGNSSHKKTLDYLITQCCSTILEPNEISEITRCYNKLKNNRINGDYRNLTINRNYSIQSIQSSEKLNQILNQIDNG